LLSLFLYGFSLTDEAEEKAEFVEGLKRDIIKVEQSIDVTKALIKKSKGALFLPDIVFRLAELYVEKSRLVYYLEVEIKGAEQAVSSPESKLLKNEAIKVYNDVMHRFPDYRYNDKVLFFLGHEFYELGLHEDMLSSYKKLVDDYPKSELLLEALYIIGDYYFNKDDLDQSENYYNKILKYRESPMHDMARYKLAWVAINKAKLDKKQWKKALSLFEQVVLSKATTEEGITVDTHKMVNIKLEAINGLVFCFTEVHKAKIALEYFGKLATSKIVYVHALEKLANRYFIKEQYDNSALLYRRIIELSNDVERNLDYAQRIYDASSFSKNKEKVDEDVKAMVKAASRYAYSWRIADEEKKQLAKEYEVYARDIVTKLHKIAQKRQEKRSYRIAADAYKNYLSFFDYSEKLEDIKYNYAESLFNSRRYLEAGRAYEVVARDMGESKNRKDALYSAIQSFQYALGEAKYLSRFGLVEARQAMKQLGGYYIKKYTKDSKTPTIKFNVARMYYDQGEYKEAIESFLEYIKKYPTHSEVAIAGHLTLDCYKQLEDFRGLAKQGRAFLANSKIRDRKFKTEVAAIVTTAENEDLDKATLEFSKDGKDAASALLDYASEVEGGKAESVIYRSFIMAKEKRNIELAFKAGGQLAKQYPKSKHLEDVYATLGNFSAQMADFERATFLYRDYFNKFPNKPEAREAMFAAAKFHVYLGNFREAVKSYQALLDRASSAKRGVILVEIADAYAKMEEWRMVLKTAQRAIAVQPDSVKAQLLLAKALQKRGKIDKAKQMYMGAASSGGPDDIALSAEAQFLVGELFLDDYRKIRFGAGQEDQLVLESKMQLIAAMEQIFAGVVQMKEPTWAIASLFRLYQVYLDFGKFLKSAPIPGEFSADQKKQYKKMIAEQAKAQEDNAMTYLDTCVKTIRSKKVFSPFAMACITRQEPVSTDKVVRRHSSGSSSGQKEDQLREKLLKNPNDLKTIDELAELAIVQSDYYKARLILSKGLEVDENHAPSLNLMGLVSFYLAEDQEAYDYFKKATSAMSKYVPARLNLAALFFKYQDKTRASAVLKSVKQEARTFNLSVPGIHPLVKDVLSQLRIR
jgi:tetratricopeptide (TPR) repeat protein